MLGLREALRLPLHLADFLGQDLGVREGVGPWMGAPGGENYPR